MTARREVVVTVSPDGSVKVEAVGFRGTSCLSETAAIEAALGKAEGRRFKPEATAPAAQKVGGGR